MHLHWYCDCHCVDVKVISNIIDPIISSPKLFPCQYFDMLKNPCVHVKVQNALRLGFKHQIIIFKFFFSCKWKPFGIVLIFFHFFGVNFFAKYKKFGCKQDILYILATLFFIWKRWTSNLLITLQSKSNFYFFSWTFLTSF
jgi:hypothetical protein